MRYLNHFEEVLSVVLLACMSVVIFLQVFFRYVISYSLDWPEELGRYLFIASVYVGSSYVEQQNKHLSVTILLTSGGKWCAKLLPMIASLVTIAFCVVMAVWGAQMVWFAYLTGQSTPAMQYPMWPIYIPLPVGMGCMGIRAGINLYRGKPLPAETVC